MAFIDEVNAVDLGQRVRAKVPLVAVGLLAAALVAGFAVLGALQPPVAVVGATGGEQQAVDENPVDERGEENPDGLAATSAEEPSDGATGASPETIVVHVGGCVATPGVYQVAADARLDDAVRAAGGMTADAAEDAVNLAAHLEDGQQVLVPSCEQVAEGQWSQSPSGVTAAISDTSGASGGAGPLNVNQATAEQLTQLNGIGDALAQRIVADREKNGPFASVDDLARVSGIGKKKLEGFREDVCV